MAERSGLVSILLVGNSASEDAEKEKAFRKVAKGLSREDLCLIDDVTAGRLYLQLVILCRYLSTHNLAAIHRLPRLSNLPRREED